MSGVSYRLAMPDPHTHLLQVELRVGGVPGEVELVMPSWTPGSYLMREFARHVQDFAAADAHGRTLAWRKTDKNTWRVAAPPDADVVARYRVYANELTVRTSHLDSSHAYLNGASVFMLVRGREREPARLEVEAPEGWRVATALERDAAQGGPSGGSAGSFAEAPAPTGVPSGATDPHPPMARIPDRSAPPDDGGAEPPGGGGGCAGARGGPAVPAFAPTGRTLHAFRARDFDELVDSPLEIGAHRVHPWEQEGIPHEYAVWGRGEYDADRVVADTRRVIDATREMFGGSLPYARFVFILHLAPEGRGGLEHASSCSLLVPSKPLEGEAYESFIALVAHEFLHVWNGKRIRPAPLGPFDYTRESYTRNLWVMEGITTYYTDLLLVRAGIMTRERYLERLGESIARLSSLPGRHHQTLEESSFDAWIRFYRPDEHTPSSQVSYYHKGALVALLLDMEIRRATGGERSLDTVMATLWERYGARDVGFPEDPDAGIRAIAEEVAGKDLGGFFERYVRGTAELEYDAALSVVGLTTQETAEPAGVESGTGEPAASAEAPGRRSWPSAPELRLGLRVGTREGRLTITHVLAGGPAHAAGVNARDEVVAIDGVRATQEELTSILERAAVGDRISLTLTRRGSLLEVPVVAGQAARRISLVDAPEPSRAALAARADWLRGAGGPPQAGSTEPKTS